MFYKILTYVLAGLLLLGGAAFAYEKVSHNKMRKSLNNQLAKAQKMQKETETAYSRLALETEDLKARNGDLQKVLDDRDEDIFAMTEASLKWKDKYLKALKAKQKIVTRDGKTVVIKEPADCEQLANSDLRVRVDFEHEEDPIKVSGHTLSNPAYAEVKIEWVKDLNLDIILAKNDDDTFRVYLDSDSGLLIPADLKLQVDPSVTEKKWYERLSVNGSLNFGEFGGVATVGVGYDILDNLSISPNFVTYYDGEKAKLFYGVGFKWNPF